MSKIILYISAFVPMYVLFLINLVVELINGNLSFNITNTCVLVFLFALMLVGIIGLVVIIHSGERSIETIRVVSKKNITDQHFLNYFSLFVLLALAFDLSKLCSVCVFIVILVFIGIVYVKNNIFYVNPLLNIMGYSFYDIVYETEEGKGGEVRIFYKGEIEVGDKQYKLSVSNKNLNFLKDGSVKIFQKFFKK
ncbi:MAG: hypothetical protein IJW59_02765 [Clostridia bacterium]|nr:hypothetical protein [Clostridia bacterium]